MHSRLSSRPSSRDDRSTHSRYRSAISPAPWRPGSRWNDRHHVADSKDNHRVIGTKRCLFDNLLGLRVRGGVYVDTCNTHQARIFDTSSGCCADELLRRAQGKLEHCPLFPDAWAAKACMKSWEIKKAMEYQSIAEPDDAIIMSRLQSQPSNQLAADGANAGAPHTKQRNPKRIAREQYDCLMAFAAVQGQEPFLRLLQWARGRFGEIARFWRLIDKDESMVVSKAEFVKDVRRQGFKINKQELDLLWNCLDRDTSGVVSFLHFDPLSSTALAMVKHWCKIYGGGVTQVASSFDKDRSGAISLQEFEQGCRRNGFPVADDSLDFLFMFIGAGRQAQVPVSSLAFLDSFECPEYLWTAPDPAAFEVFKDFLMDRCKDNGIRAWRKSLDRDSSMRVPWLDFKRTLQSMRDRHPKEFGFVNIAGIWRQLDPMCSGWITLGDFDMRGYVLLSNFVVWAKREHGSVSRMMRSLLPSSVALEKGLGRGKLAKAIMEPLNLNEEDTDLLFGGLNLEEGDRVQITEIKFLEHWDPVTEQEERRGWEKYFGARLQKASEVMVSFTPEGFAMEKLTSPASGDKVTSRLSAKMHSTPFES